MSKKSIRSKCWIEKTFQKRECIKFMPSAKDASSCSCGKTMGEHDEKLHSRVPQEYFNKVANDEHWSALRHTLATSTDAYGTIEFQGSSHPLKAKYVRMGFDTRPEVVLQLITKEWNLELPKLLISVHGGKANFELQAKLKSILQKGLVKAAKTTGAWIITGGTNTGVMKHVGEAIQNERSPRLRERVVTMGVASWGIIENRKELIGHNTVVPYCSISSPKSRFSVLNSHHSYFILADNGTVGRYGAEIVLRKKLERYISKQQIYKRHDGSSCGVPVVCVVVEGGVNTIRTVLEYVTDTPPVPVVICDGSGRSADLIAFAHKYLYEDDSSLLDVQRSLLKTIEQTFSLAPEQSEQVYIELLQCIRRRNLITVFRMGEEGCEELDQAILTALINGHHLAKPDQLALALTWNRVDIARSEVFVYGIDWPRGSLEQAMMDALMLDRVDFVKLLLENGVSMHKFLTISRLEDLYNTKYGPTNTLQYIVRDVKKHIPRGYKYQLYDIGLVIEKLMGGAYRSSYCRRKFRHLYHSMMKRNPKSLRHNGVPGRDEISFNFPFSELLIWAVLMKRQKMALFMWQHGEEAIVKALIACKLFKAMAREAAEDDLEMEIFSEMLENAAVFERIALELIDYCYRQDDDMTLMLLTHELQNWSKQTCLSLAVIAKHNNFLAHPAAQVLVADLWLGGLRIRKTSNLKIILGLLFPPMIMTLRFKTKEELQLMPQTEEEHRLDLEDDEDNDSIKSVSSVASQFKCEKLKEDPSPNASPTNQSLNRKLSNLENGDTDGDSVRSISAAVNQLKFEHLKDDHFSNSSPTNTLRRYQKHFNKPDLSRSGSRATMDNTGSSSRMVHTEHIFNDVTDFHDYSILQTHSPLKLGIKIYEFYAAPITKFWLHSLAYLVFLCTFTYTCLVKMSNELSWAEIYTIAYSGTFGIEKFREVIFSEPKKITQKLVVWTEKKWNPVDVAVIIFFFIGVFLRLEEETRPDGRIFYVLSIMYWYLRVLDILSVNKYLGPFVSMIWKMVINMIYFVVFLVIVLMSYGVARQAIFFPNEEPSWRLVRHIFFMPYWMIYGEVFADTIEPDCGEGEDVEQCETGMWLNPAIMAIYLLIANILLINLLIAVFNNIFQEVSAISQQLWKAQRYRVVIEYEQKTVLPPPFIVISHLVLLWKFFLQKWERKSVIYDHGLKLFLNDDDVERINDFEEECVEGYLNETELKSQESQERQLRETVVRVENIAMKVDDITQQQKKLAKTLDSFKLQTKAFDEQLQAAMENMNLLQNCFLNDSNVEAISETYIDDPRNDTPSPSPPPPCPRTETEMGDVSDDETSVKDLYKSAESIQNERDASNTALEAAEDDLHTELPNLQARSSFRRSVRKLRGEFTRRQSSLPSKDEAAAAAPDVAFPRLNKAAKIRGKSMSEVENVSALPTFIPRQRSKVERSSSNISSGRHANVNVPICVIPPSPRYCRRTSFNEYTSITDDLEENVVIRSPAGSLRNPVSRTNSFEHERALAMETEILHGAEEADYHLMEPLIQRRLRRESEFNQSLEELGSIHTASDSENENETVLEPVTFGVNSDSSSKSSLPLSVHAENESNVEEARARSPHLLHPNWSETKF